MGTGGQPALDEHDPGEPPAASPTPTAELAHDVANFLSALSLRVEFLKGDATCRAAQPDALAALERIAKEATVAFLKLQEALKRETPISGTAP